MSQDLPAGSLFRDDRLADAIAAATAAVRAAPAVVQPRMALAELLLFTGDLQRADTLLDAAAMIDPSFAVAIAAFRQLLRAEQARRQLLEEGRVPDFLDSPTDAQRAMLSAVVALRAQDVAGAAARLAEAEALRPTASFVVDDRAVDTLRDCDDLLSGSLEVLTTTGQYLWIPWERVLTLAFHQPRRLRDLFWRHAALAVSDGPQGDVYVPAIYVPIGPASDDLLMGRATDWYELGADLVRGIGQRLLLAGDEGLPIMEIGQLRAAA